ncbi:MAG: hypothetical protein IJT25_01150 [Clostridia bacterium]|nr:hypothetical protein [Clostridia bacterium]
MKNATKVMYTIGRVFNVIGIVCSALLLVFSILVMIDSQNVFNQLIADGVTRFSDAKAIYNVGIAMLVWACIYLIVEIVIYTLAKKAQKSIAQNSANTTPHIVMLIIGIFGDIFYLIGGIFGVIAAGNNESK